MEEQVTLQKAIDIAKTMSSSKNEAKALDLWELSRGVKKQEGQ